MSANEQRPASLRGPLAKSIAALLVGLLASPPAWAGSSRGSDARQKTPTLALVPLALDEGARPAAARMSLAGENAIRALGRYEVAELAHLLDPGGSKVRADRAGDGKAAYDAARKAYDDLDLQKAAELCSKALAALEKADLSESFDALVTAWTLRVAALEANAENKLAQAELGLLLPVGARASFDPAVFNPDFIAHVKQRRDDLLKKSDLSYSVESKPTSARVFVDGQLRGVTPMEVKDLSPGDHFLTLIAPGYALTQKRFRAGPGSTEIAQLDPVSRLGGLQALLDALKRDLRPATRVSGGRADDARALAQDLGVDQVVVVSLTSQAGGVRAVATRVAYDGKELSFLDEAVADDGARLADFVSRVAGRELKGGGQGGLRWTSRYTGFTLVGLGVGIAGMGGAFGMAAKNSSDGFKTLHDQPQTNAIWDQRASEGRRYALVADISYIAALALVGTGLYFAITGKNADEESEPQPEIRIEEKKKEPEPARPADKKKPDDAKKPDDKRKAEDDRKAAEDRKRAEDEKKAAEDRKKADEDRKAEEKRKTEDETKISEEKRKAEAEEKKAKKAEDKRKAEDDKKAAEDARFAEEKKKFEEEQKAEQEADKKKADEARRKADEEKRKAEEEKKKAEEKKKKDEKKIQDFDDLRDDK